MIRTPYNLICFSHLPWSMMWKRTQTLMDHLSRSRQIHQVIFVNPAVWLARLIFDFRTQMSPSDQKLYRFSWKAVIPRRVGDKVTAVTPVHFIPWTRSNPSLGRLQRKFHLWILNRLIQDRDYILFLNDFNFNPECRQLVEPFLEKAKLVVFDWSDDFVEFFQSPEERRKVNEVCEDYIRKSHVVLTVNENLTERAKRLNPRSYTIPNAVDVERMSNTTTSAREVPEALQSLSKPLIGYIGTITPTRIDSELLTHLARKRSDWTLVLMGTVPERFKRLFETYKNIVFLPPVDFRVLSRYLSCFDVCIIPHKINNHTRGNDLLKLYNYLAARKPVVSTAISGLERFSDVVYIAKDREEFQRLVERALKEDGADLREERLKRARENSWDSRVAEVRKILESNLREMRT
jgi:glycosyltransferase involved in cell wall biosynthesis